MAAYSECLELDNRFHPHKSAEVFLHGWLCDFTSRWFMDWVELSGMGRCFPHYENVFLLRCKPGHDFRVRGQCHFMRKVYPNI